MSDPVRDYLNYVREVLGARHVVAPKSHDPEKSQLKELARTRTGHWPDPVDFDVLVLHHGAGLFEGATAELWEKMKTAMNLGETRILELETSVDDLDGVLLEALEIYPAPVSLILSRKPLRTETRVLGMSKTFESYAPSMLVESADLKRNAWGDLQLVMKELGLRR